MTEEEMKSHLNKLDRILVGFHRLSPTMPLAQVHAFLLIALNEGISGVEVSRMAEMPQSTISRYLLDFSDKMRSGDKGYGLLLRNTDPEELRRNRYYLSPKGKHFLRELSSSFA